MLTQFFTPNSFLILSLIVLCLIAHYKLDRDHETLAIWVVGMINLLGFTFIFGLTIVSGFVFGNYEIVVSSNAYGEAFAETVFVTWFLIYYLIKGRKLFKEASEKQLVRETGVDSSSHYHKN